LRSILGAAWLAKCYCYKPGESLPREVHAAQTAWSFLLSPPCLRETQCYQRQLINTANLTGKRFRIKQFLSTHSISVPDLWRIKGKKVMV